MTDSPPTITTISDPGREWPTTAEHRPDGGIILGVATHKGTFRVMLNGREARRLATATRASQQAAKDASGIVFTTRSRPPILRYQAADADIAKTPS